MKIFQISSYFSSAGTIFIAIFCLLFYFKDRAKYIKILGFYAIFSIILDFAQKNANDRDLRNLIGNGFVLSEAIFLGLIFYFAVESKFFKKYILALLILYVAYYGFVFLFLAEYSFSYIRLGRDLLMILFAIAYFYYLIRKLPEENLLKFPMFWINTAVIFFFSGTFILSLFRDYIVTVLKDDTSGFWAFRNFFRFAFCFVLAYAGWLDWRSITKNRKI